MRATKSFDGVELKADGMGGFRATLARFDQGPDKEGDVYAAGAFPVGKSVVVSAYMHMSWYGALPVGKGTIGADEKSAWIDGQFFTDTTSGKDTYLVVKALAESGQGEWSYGYDVLDFSTSKDDLAGHGDGAKRLLKELDVFEASPVLVGAGVATGTDFVKAIKEPYSDQAERVLASAKAWLDRSRELAALRAKEGRVLSTANRDRLNALADALNGALGDITELLASTDSVADDGKALDAWLEFEQARMSAAGLI